MDNKRKLIQTIEFFIIGGACPVLFVRKIYAYKNINDKISSFVR